MLVWGTISPAPAGGTATGDGASSAAWGGPSESTASTSALTIRPRGPVPRSAARSSPARSAIRRASGLAKILSAAPSGPPCREAAADAAAAGGGAGVSGAASGPDPAGAGRKPSSAAASSPSPSRTAIGWFTGTPSVPSATSSRPTRPPSAASSSIAALSVSTSAMTSPAATLSPSFTSQRASVPSVIVGDRAGMATVVGIPPLRTRGARIWRRRRRPPPAAGRAARGWRRRASAPPRR